MNIKEYEFELAKAIDKFAKNYQGRIAKLESTEFQEVYDVLYESGLEVKHVFDAFYHNTTKFLKENMSEND